MSAEEAIVTEVDVVGEENPAEAKTASPQEFVANLLGNLDGPSSEEVDKWKAKYGDVFVYAFSDTEIYVFRSLKRNEFRELQLRLADPKNEMDQLEYEETICAACVLWPAVSKEDFSLGKGGTATSLSEQIMLNSNFTSPQSPVMVVKL